jgi:hypothetical protein
MKLSIHGAGKNYNRRRRWSCQDMEWVKIGRRRRWCQDTRAGRNHNQGEKYEAINKNYNRNRMRSCQDIEWVDSYRRKLSIWAELL